MTSSSGRPLFQQYQLEFAGHIRNPQVVAKPYRASTRGMRVYRQIVFNNLESTLAGCFPVCKATLGIRLWKKLVRGFFIHHQSHSPLFRQIPEEFLSYLGQLDRLAEMPSLPTFLRSLAHYEWVELAVSVADVRDDLTDIDPHGDLISGTPVLTASLALLTYDYAVQHISPRYKPKEPLPQAVHLLVFRNADDQVKFIELNVATARLLGLLQSAEMNGLEVLQTITVEMNSADEHTFLAFGREILVDLKQQGVILGVKSTVK